MRKFLFRSSSVVALVVGCSMLMQVSRADAACTPTAPVNNTTVTCTGTTANQNGNNGYGTGAETILNINVQTGATVTGSSSGLAIGDNNVIQNSGTISSTAGVNPLAITAGHTLNLTNSAGAQIAGAVSAFDGIISNSGTMGPIIFNTGSSTVASAVSNSGTITGNGAGPAITFQAGSLGNVLTLGTTSVINGNVIGAGSDILELGGTGNATLNVIGIGAGEQYRGFSTFRKIGASTWTLTGSGTQNWDISGGTLIGDTNSLQGGLITNNSVLAFNQNFTGTFGAGSLAQARRSRWAPVR